MVDLQTVRSRNSTLAKSQSLVAVVVGGTSGIGKYTVSALAAEYGKSGKELRVYIVGRNKKAAETLISESLQVCPTGDFRFVPTTDISLLKEVDRVSAEIASSEEKSEGTARVDLLVMTQGYVALEARLETVEGLDTLLSLLYYSRMRFITQLLPLLSSSPLPGHVVSVFSPKRDQRLFVDDLSLRNPTNYGFMNMGSHASYMTTFFMEKLAEKHAGKLSLSHYFPGIVVTEGYSDERLPTWFKLLWRYFFAHIIWLFDVPREESGQRVLFHSSARFPARGQTAAKSDENLQIAVSSDGVLGGGAYRVDWNGETIPANPKMYKKLREDRVSEKIWEHTMKAFEDIEAGKAFIE